MARKALIVACSKFDDDRLADLPELPALAAELAAVLGDSTIGRYEVTVALDPTALEFRRRISRLFKDVGPADTVLLYIGGHGMNTAPGGLRFAASDTRLSSPVVNFVPAELVEDLLDHTSCGNAVVVLDCDHAELFRSPRPLRPTFARLIVASEPVASRGMLADFTATLIEGLRTGIADLGLDGVITGEDLSRYLVDFTGQRPPAVMWAGPLGELHIADNPSSRRQKSDLPPLPGAAAEVRPDADVDWTSDSPARDDLLHREDLAALLADQLIEIQLKQPDSSFLVHLDGAWGTGKSTLLNFIRPNLEKNFLLVEFDAWRQARLAHPWWTLLTAARDEIAADLGWWRAKVLRVRESFNRVRRTGAQYVFALGVLALFAGGLAFWLWPAKGTAAGWNEAAKVVTAVLAATIPLWTGSLIASRYLLWNSARGAKLFEQSGTNPMTEVSAHFSWLLGRSKKPVVFLVDDLDRCGQEQVVDLLDTVQTLFRDSSRQAPFFVVAADGAWLRKSYETKYTTFDECVARPGKPLGYLFLDKLFQLTVPMPLVTSSLRKLYVDRLLQVADPADAQVAAEVDSLRERLTSDRGQEREILELLDESSSAAKAEVVGDAARALYQPGTRKRTEHALRKFAPLLGDNPRGMKLFVNTYSVFRAIRTLEGNTVGTDTLALWCIVRVRWPDLFDHLQANPPAVAGVLDPILVGDHFPERLQDVAASAEVREVMASPMGGPLFEDRIKQCCGDLGGD
ncbi:P-loop NTPase fold protein [Amycolatopsis sp. w19]|uniref:P-loop NTPase fold protein n=1 Tax=Amycolatopsis sp. w19 TaxID=3448134 RepID=UPI003F1CA840